MAPPRRAVDRVCETCGKAFLAVPSLVKRGGGRFCSRPCRREPDSVRFWRKARVAVIEHWTTGPRPDYYEWKGCFEWTGSKEQHGYGRFWSNERRKVVPAHHMAWRLEHGVFPPDGLFLCHRCDNPPCVNPAHLFVGTASDNMQDCVAKGRYQKKRVGNFRRGAGVVQARLYEAAIPLIREAAASGEPLSAIARRYGVNRTTVTAIVRRKTWRHVL